MGGDFQAEGAVFTQASQEKLTSKNHLLRRHGFVHFLRARGSYGGLLLYLGLRDHDKEQQMAGEKLARRVYDLGSHGGFGQVGNPDHQSALLLEREQSCGGADVVGLRNFGSDDGELFDQMA